MIITYPSALEFWLDDKGIPYSVSSRMLPEPITRNDLTKENHSRKQITEALAYLNFNNPVHVCIPDGIPRYNTAQVIAHRLPAHLPPNSFIHITDDIYISSPELCFLLAAREMTPDELVYLACNLCAIYVKDPYDQYGQRHRDPIASVESIKKYLNKCTRVRGVQDAKKAIQYALNCSNSPRESQLATVGVLPQSYGGYGIYRPDLNLDLNLSKNGAEFLRRKTICCDMIWKKQRIVLEYDSNLSHMNAPQVYKDKRRSTALSFSNYKTISITDEQLQSFRSIEELFLNVRNALGMRTYMDRMDKYLEKRRDVVQRIILDHNFVNAEQSNSIIDS